MRLRILLFALLVLASSTVLRAEPPAGAVLYFRQGGETYLLMADHLTDRGWAAFGGGAEAGESIAETAARETEEETRGYFARANLLTQMEGLTPFVYNGFNLYFVEVPFVPVQRISNHQPPKGEAAFLERGPYAWVPFSEIERSLALDGDTPAVLDPFYLPVARKTDYLWSVWIASIRAAYAADALPWVSQLAQ